MATKLESISTSWRLKQGKHLIPNMVELQMMDVPVWNDDFMGRALIGGEAIEGDATLISLYQSTASGANSVAAAIAAGTVGGKLRLDPGDANSGRSDLSLGRHFRGDLNAHAWARITTPAAIGSWKFEWGLTDVVSGTDAGAVATKATPTFNADDAVVLVYDTNDDANLTLVGVKATTADTAIDFATALAAATDYYLGIELRDDQARGYLLNADGKLLETTAWMDDAVTSTVLLTPWAFTQNRSGAQRLLDIDMIRVYQRRTTA